MRNKKDKRGIQISFAWLFAIIVGAFILFLAIFAVTRITDTSREVVGAKGAKEIGVLLNPLETGFEEARSVLMSVSADTKIHNRCNEIGEFGTQTIRVSQKSFGKWSETDIDVGFSNKYIFSEADVEGRNFYIFSKKFEFPFKVSDVIFITSSSDNYCFVEAPDEIANEITDLSQENLYVNNEISKCPAGSKIVCFEQEGCDVDVRYSWGEVTKNDETLSFVNDAMMYGAIFSDAETYECQVKRLMKRAENLAILYGEKAGLLADEGCSAISFSSYKNALKNIQTSEDLFSEDLFTAFEEAEKIGDENKRAGGARCELW